MAQAVQTTSIRFDLAVLSGNNAPIPSYPPAWASVFGEDHQGIFCTPKGLELEFRWVPPYLVYLPEGHKPRQLLIEPLWLAETALPKQSGGFSVDIAKEHIAALIAQSQSTLGEDMFTVRLPTFYELLAAKENLREVVEARRIPTSVDQRELCTNNGQYGLTALHSEEPTFEVITDTSKELASSGLRLAISVTGWRRRD